MRVVRDAYVVLDYVLYDEDGDVVEATDDEGGRPIGFVHGYATLVPGLERALVGMAAGETREVVVAPEEGYGAHDPELEQWVDRSDFPDELALDDEFAAETDDGRELTLRVVEIEGDAVLVDGNHPLAGETLRFDVMVRSVRRATEKEIAETRAHAPRPRLGLLPTAAPDLDPGGAESSATAAGWSAPTASTSAAPSRTEDAPSRATSRGIEASASHPRPGGTHPQRKEVRKPSSEPRSTGRRAAEIPAELEDEQ
jgi:FKBP-type peptidyl-prolyl cis-trans isomerase SlyD